MMNKRRLNPNSKWWLVLIPLFMVSAWVYGWTYTYDTATPADSESPRLGDDRIREVKTSLQERLAVDHQFELTGTEVSDADTGKHNQVTFYDSSNADTDPNLHIRAVSGVHELHFDDPCENRIQLTSAGSIYIATDSIDSNMISDVNTSKITDGTILATDLDSDANDFCDDTTLEIDGTVGLRVKDAGIATAKIADDAVTAAKIDSVFGSWASKSNNTAYEAATDGFAIAIVTGSSNDIQGYTDASNPPVTLRTAQSTAGFENQSAIMPVRKGDYWKFTGATTVYWLPLGAE